MFENYSDILTVNDLCKMLHIGKNTAYRLISDKSIQSFKIGKKILIPKSEIIAYVNKENKSNICYNNLVNSNAVVI